MYSHIVSKMESASKGDKEGKYMLEWDRCGTDVGQAQFDAMVKEREQ